jgi:hypothetical protein
MELRNQIPEKRESIIHAQNVFFTAPVNIFPRRETGRYVIGYEPKTYRVHYLLYKIDKRLVSNSKPKMEINTAVDINIREDFRYSVKLSDPNSRIEGKTVVFRIVPARYAELPPIYGTIFQFTWRRTGMGGIDELSFKISECPTVSNSTTVNTVCYKKIGSQVSFGGTHGTSTFIIISPQRGEYNVGEWLHMSNVNAGGHHHGYTRPVTITL